VNLSHVKEDVDSNSTNEQLSQAEFLNSHSVRVEPTNDEEQLNQIKEEIKKEEETKPVVEVVEEVKPKPKRKPAVKKVKEEVAVVVEQPQEEPKEEPKKTKTVELVKCDKCGKEMTKRTLRYDHEKTCSGVKIEREKIPVKRRTPVKKEVDEKETVETKINIPEEIIEQEVKKRIQNSVQDRIHQRMKVKEEKIKKLASQIA
jgi:hypothetical protein